MLNRLPYTPKAPMITKTQKVPYSANAEPKIIPRIAKNIAFFSGNFDLLCGVNGHNQCGNAGYKGKKTGQKKRNGCYCKADYRPNVILLHFLLCLIGVKAERGIFSGGLRHVYLRAAPGAKGRIVRNFPSAFFTKHKYILSELTLYKLNNEEENLSNEKTVCTH